VADAPVVDTLERPAARPGAVHPQIRRARRRTSRTAWVLRLVAIGYVLALVALPVVSVIQHTFEDGLAPVWEVITSDDFLAALKLTAIVGGIAVVLNTVFGVGMGILLVRYRFWGRRFISAVIDLPVSISPIVVGVALILVYGTYGWFGGALEDAGFRVIFSVPGMVLATVLVSLPLVMREVVPTLEEAGIEQEQAAQSLGATAWQRFWRVTLPTIKWALAYGVALSLARSLGEFGAVRVVSGSVAGQSQTLTLYVNDSYQEFGPDAQRQAFAAAFVLMAIAVALIVVIAALRPKEDRS
jgi:sulfate/thiosulfate transport system permease protein